MQTKQQRDIEKLAYKELAVKLKFEKVIKPLIKRFIKSIAKDFKTVYRLSGNIVSVEDYAPELEGILKHHYRKVSNYFLSSALENTKKLNNESEIKSDIETEIRNRVRHFINDEPEKRSSYINETTQEDLKKYVKSAIIYYLLKRYRFDSKEQISAASERIQQVISNTSLADAIKTSTIQNIISTHGGTPKKNGSPDITALDVRENVSDFAKSRLDYVAESRSDLIATTETQNAAETSKQISLSALAASVYAVGQSATGKQLKKQWIAVLDERTRAWHAKADTQIKDVDDPFIVNGELLMQPGDQSLGASLDNIINCRCSSMPIIYTNFNDEV